MSGVVIYFSKSGSNWVEDGVKNIEIGNTEMLAKLIQSKVGGDIFEIKANKKYPDEYYSCTEEAKKEVEDNIFPETLNCPENLDKYDTIYIGHPIWWNNMPNAVIGFLKKYQWNGKTIYPFCTHEGSGMSKSPDTLKSICKDAIIKPYFEIRGYMCQDAENYDIENKINPWLEM